MNRLRGLRACAALWTVVALGCAQTPTRGPEPDPRGVLEAWHAALVDGRPRDAFALLDPAATEGLDEAAFVALYTRQREALIVQATRILAQVRSSAPEERATVALSGALVTLVRTPAGWRLTSPVGTAAPPAPPAPPGPPAPN
jgi:hypothetical protein